MATHKNFQTMDKTNSGSYDLSKRRMARVKGNARTKEERFQEGLKLWVGYFRSNPHRFVSEYLQITPFSLFQKMLLCLMFHFDYFLWWASRGLGKSHLTALYCLVRCILYPGTKICIAAKNRGQSLNIISEKIKTFYDKSPMVQREISELKDNPNNPIVRFRNGSWIKIVTASDSSRSARANVLVVDEFRMVDGDVIQKVLRKFLTSRREPGYIKHEKYKDFREPNTEIYLSSIGMKSEWSFDKFLAFYKAMTEGKKYFTCGFPYQLGIRHNIIDRQKMIDEMQEDDFDPISWSMEMDCIPFGESESAYFKYEELNKNREIKKAIIPITTRAFAELGEKKLSKWKFYQQKSEGEIRILSLDVALMAGRENDNSAFTLIRCIPDKGGYLKVVPYMETLNGENTEVLALRAKQLFYNLECDYIVMDTSGNGLGVYDILTSPTIDSDRGVEYPAWIAMNDDKMIERANDKHGIPVIYSVKVAASAGSQWMHQMYVYTKNQFQKGKVKLLVNEYSGKEYLTEKHDFLKIDANEQAWLMAPFYQTSKLINEAINLEMSVESGLIRLKEKSGQRKDRIVSLMYGLEYARILELKMASNNSPWDSFVKQGSVPTNQNVRVVSGGFGSRFEGFRR